MMRRLIVCGVIVCAASAGVPDARTLRVGVEAGVPDARTLRVGVEAGVPDARTLRVGVEAAVAAADWPMWGGTPSRNMVSDEKGMPTAWDIKTGKNVKWVAELGSQSYGNPTVAEGV